MTEHVRELAKKVLDLDEQLKTLQRDKSHAENELKTELIELGAVECMSINWSRVRRVFDVY